MIATFVHYDDYMASLGNPDHHILVGPDWWGCLCGMSCGPYFEAQEDATHHSVRFSAEMVKVDYELADLEDIGSVFGDVHQWLWEQEAF